MTLNLLSDSYISQLKFFENNKTRDYNEWLIFLKKFKNKGKQGITGLTLIDNQKCVFKISRYFNYTILNEYIVTNSLKSVTRFCINFVNTIGSINCFFNTSHDTQDNPFMLKDKQYKLEKEIMLTEYIPTDKHLYDLIRDNTIKDQIIISAIKQVLLAILIAQKHKKFVHYDLHSLNILMKKCDKNLVMLYVLDKDNQFSIPTFGYYPVIIDYGFSYSSDLQDEYLYSSMNHTHVGFNSYRFDEISDFKLFLISISNELTKHRNNSVYKSFRTHVLDIFKNLDVDTKSGWDLSLTDSYREKSITRQLIKTLDYTKSRLFDDYTSYCIDIIQSLIILPFEKTSYKNINKHYKDFIEQWLIIENQFNYVHSIYILKMIVDTARIMRSDFLNNKLKKFVVNEFYKNIVSITHDLSIYCNIKKLDCEKMLSCLYKLADCIEGKFYSLLRDEMGTSTRYDCQKPSHIFAIVHSTLVDNYRYTDKTKILVINSLHESNKIIDVDRDEGKMINNQHNVCKGTYIYDNLYD